MFSLQGMNALVTGASGGIGSAIAYALAKQGARLALSGSNAEKLRVFREQLISDVGSPETGDHVAITCNLSDSEEVDNLIPAAVDTLGGVDILVNNAGITRDGLMLRMPDEDWNDVLATNLHATFRLSRAASAVMLRLGRSHLLSSRRSRTRRCS